MEIASQTQIYNALSANDFWDMLASKYMFPRLTVNAAISHTFLSISCTPLIHLIELPWWQKKGGLCIRILKNEKTKKYKDFVNIKAWEADEK